MWEDTDFRALRRHVVDIELTNRCNATCDFCPRDATPQQGVMAPDVFARVLARVVEFRDAMHGATSATVEMSFCGLGEQLLNPHAAEYVARMRASRIDPVLTTNGALLTDDRARALLDSGLSRLFVNASELGADYERTYHIPFEPTRRNIARFVELAAGRCEVWVVLVDHRHDPARLRAVEAFWRALGVTKFFPLPLNNRAGSLHVQDMLYEQHPHVAAARARLAALEGRTFCAAPFAFPFIGYDGRYYLCSSDWRKQVPVGHVDEHSLVDVIGRKLHHVVTHEPICRSCPHDPVNHLADTLRAIERGQVDADEAERVVDQMVREARTALRVLAPYDRGGEKPFARRMAPGDVSAPAPGTAPPR